VNRQLERLADDKRVFWLHLSAEGYATWAKAMQPKIEELIKP
jgi:hypothetical protein